MLDGTQVLGLPGCVMYAAATIFDLVLPRVAAGVAELTRRDITRMGAGGLCLGCPDLACSQLRVWKRSLTMRKQIELEQAAELGLRRSAHPWRGRSRQGFCSPWQGCWPGYDQPAAQPAL